VPLTAGEIPAATGLRRCNTVDLALGRLCGSSLHGSDRATVADWWWVRYWLLARLGRVVSQYTHDPAMARVGGKRGSAARLSAQDPDKKTPRMARR